MTISVVSLTPAFTNCLSKLEQAHLFGNYQFDLVIRHRAGQIERRRHVDMEKVVHGRNYRSVLLQFFLGTNAHPAYW